MRKGQYNPPPDDVTRPEKPPPAPPAKLYDKLGRRVSLTKGEFEQRYAERSGCSVEDLRGMGRTAVPCNCGEAGCEGWQMSHLR